MINSPRIFAAIKQGKPAFDEKHAAMRFLWRRFGRAIRQDRKELGIPLKSFAEKLGYSTAMVSFLESGKREWSLAAATKAVAILLQ